MPTSQSHETDRVRRHTPPEINNHIDAETDTTLQRYTGASREVLSRRIDEPDREWDIERALETNAASVALLSLILARMHNRKWMWLSTGVARHSCCSMPCRDGVRRFRYFAGSGLGHRARLTAKNTS